MLRTLSSGAGVEMALGARAASIASVMWACHLPSARACPGHPRLFSCDVSKTWMAGTGPAMTSVGTISPPKPFRLARQFDGLDLLELDGALGHEIVEVAVGWPCDFRAIKIDLQRAAMVLLGPCRGIADAVHAGRHPILLLIEALGHVLAGGAAVLGGPVERFLQVQRAANARDVMHGTIDLARRVRHL